MTITVGEAVDLEPAGGSARAVADERNGIVHEIRVRPASCEDRLVGEQFDPVVDRRNRSDQLVTQASRQKLQHPQIERAGNYTGSRRQRHGHSIGNPVERRSR